MNKRFTKNDGVFLLITGVCCIILILWFSFFKRERGEYVTVMVDKNLYGTYSLNQEQVIEIRLEDGSLNILQIAEGKADMIEANCPDKTCVHQKAISHDQETIVCLPHRIVVTIVNGQASDLDAIVN